MMKKSVVTLVFFFLVCGSALACECIFQKETLKQQIDRYSFVFYAQVDSLLDDKKAGYHPKLNVLEIFKADSKVGLKEGELLLENSGSICDRVFNLGERLLVFGHKGLNGVISVSICDPLWVFDSHEEFLLERKKIQCAARRNF